MTEQFPGDSGGVNRTPAPPRSGITLAEVRFDDFVEAQQDPEVAEFLQEAKAESDELKAAGLIHPGG